MVEISRPSILLKLRQYLARCLWVLCVLGLIILGVRSLSRILNTPLQTSGGPWPSSDLVLGGLAVEHPSTQVLQALAAVPLDAAILFVGLESDTSFIQTYYAISHLAQPRQVGALACRDASDPPAIVIPPNTPIKTVMFYRLQPPANLSVVSTIGQELVLASVSKMEAWTYYCLR